MIPEIPSQTAHFGGQPGDQVAKVRHDLTTICAADLRQETADVGQQTASVFGAKNIAEVLQRTSEVSDGILHGTELVHKPRDRIDRVTDLADAVAEAL